MRKETTKEAAERMSTRVMEILFKDEKKWQQERSYSEEDMREAFKQSRQAKIFEKDMPPVYKSFEEWFEQFKKK
jgi:hypothetical protein